MGHRERLGNGWFGYWHHFARHNNGFQIIDLRGVSDDLTGYNGLTYHHHAGRILAILTVLKGLKWLTYSWTGKLGYRQHLTQTTMAFRMLVSDLTYHHHAWSC